MDFMNKLMDCLGNIEYSTFDEGYINELLDNRDNASFDAEWCRVDAEMGALKNSQNYGDENKMEQDKVREQAFMIVEQNVEGELAEYVSDDFGLIYDSLVLGYKDDWLDWLIEEYQNARIPAGER